MFHTKCNQCGKDLYPKESWRTNCFDCFRNNKSQGGRPGNTAQASHSRQASRPIQRVIYADPVLSFADYLAEIKEKKYFRDSDKIREDLLTEHARVVALQLVDSEVSAGQIRRFFSKARSIEQKLDTQTPFDSIKGDLEKMQPHAANIVGREQSAGKRERLECLHEFIVANVNLAKESESAFRKGFLPHFESILAYFTYYKPKNSSR